MVPAGNFSAGFRKGEDMDVKSRMPKVDLGGFGKSVEVRHARRGVGLMLRRGLHGAKNWALEPGEDGPRGPGGKAVRALALLAPALPVLSVLTGPPATSEPSMGAFQALLLALVATLLGLAWFSARERRLGREEPWLDLPEIATESHDATESVEVSRVTGEAPEGLASSQVNEVSVENERTPQEEKPENVTQSTQNDPEAFHEAFQISFRKPSVEEVNFLTPQGESPAEEHLPARVPPAVPGVPETPEGEPDGDDMPDWLAEPVPHPSGASVEPCRDPSENEEFPQVSHEMEAVPVGSREVVEPEVIPDETDAAESNRNAVEDGAPSTFHPAFQGAFHPDESPQVSAVKRRSTPPFQEAFQVEYATPGPYGVTEGPISEDWWLTPPDAPEVKAPSGVASDAPAPVDAVEAPEETLTPEEARTPDDNSPEAGEGWDAGAEPGAPPVVTRYYRSRVASVNRGEKMDAKRAVIEWAKREIGSQGRSQAEVARLLGVGTATVSRWVKNEDPWADMADEESD